MPLFLRSRVEDSAIRVEVRPWGCSVTSERYFYLEEERGRGGGQGYNGSGLDALERERKSPL